MVFYRCQCGDSSSIGSMGPRPCDRCPHCKSSLAIGPMSHTVPKPHSMYTSRVKTDDGPQPITRCWHCHRRRAEILRLDPDAMFETRGVDSP